MGEEFVIMSAVDLDISRADAAKLVEQLDGNSQLAQKLSDALKVEPAAKARKVSVPAAPRNRLRRQSMPYRDFVKLEEERSRARAAKHADGMRRLQSGGKKTTRQAAQPGTSASEAYW